MTPVVMLSLTQDQRRELLAEAARRLGGKVALGQRLGYRDGAFVGQMIRGQRPVTENTLDRLSEIHQAREIAASMAQGVPPTRASEPPPDPDKPTETERLISGLVDLVASLPGSRWESVRSQLDLLAKEPARRAAVVAELRLLLGATAWDGTTDRRTGLADRRQAATKPGDQERAA